MGVVLLIIKILLIIVLSLLGIVIALLLLVLFLPVFYKVNASYSKESNPSTKIFFKVNWFIIKVYSVQDKSGQIKIIGRILGIKVYSNNLNEKESFDEEENLGGAFVDIPLIIPDDNKEQLKNENDNFNYRQAVEIKTEKNKIENNLAVSNKTESIKTENNKIVDIYTKENKKLNNKTIENNTNGIKTTNNIKDKLIEKFKKDNNKEKRKITSNKNDNKKNDNKKSNLFDRFSDLTEKIDKYKILIKKEYSKRSYALVKKLLKRTIKELLPRRMYGEVLFGTKSPSTTGKIMGYIAIFIPVYKNSINFYPDFYEQKLEGEIKARGRIQLAVIAIIALRLYMSKDIRKTIKAYKKI